MAATALYRPVNGSASLSSLGAGGEMGSPPAAGVRGDAPMPLAIATAWARRLGAEAGARLGRHAALLAAENGATIERKPRAWFARATEVSCSTSDPLVIHVADGLVQREMDLCVAHEVAWIQHARAALPFGDHDEDVAEAFAQAFCDPSACPAPDEVQSTFAVLWAAAGRAPLPGWLEWVEGPQGRYPRMRGRSSGAGAVRTGATTTTAAAEGRQLGQRYRGDAFELARAEGLPVYAVPEASLQVELPRPIGANSRAVGKLTCRAHQPVVLVADDLRGEELAITVAHEVAHYRGWKSEEDAERWAVAFRGQRSSTTTPAERRRRLAAVTAGETWSPLEAGRRLLSGAPV